MKLSLRNFALMGAAALSAAVYAQDAVTPTVTKVWNYDFKVENKNEVRFGTGVNGKVFYNDKAAGKIMVVDKDGVKEYAAVEGIGVGITADDAGNLLVNTGFPGEASSTNWVIVSTDGEKTPITLTLPDATGVAPGRVDQIGRVVGDINSADGAFVFMGINQVQNALLFEFSNGEQVTDNLSYYVSDPFKTPTVNTSAILQPTKTFAEMLDAGDDAIKAFSVRNRSTKNIYYYNIDDEFAAMPTVANANTQEGYDVFMLGDVMYQVMPTKKEANYESCFAIADEAGNAIYEDENPVLGDAAQSFGSFAARKVSESKVEVYQWFCCGAMCRAAMYEVTIPAKSTKGVFAYGLKSSLENNKYTFTFKAGGEAPAANLVLTNAADENDVVTIPMGAVRAGLNTFVTTTEGLKEGANYNWAVEVTGAEIAETFIENMGNFGDGRNALVAFTDPELDSFGRLLVGQSKNNGFNVFDADGTKLADRIHAQNPLMGVGTTNSSNPMRGQQRGDEALVACWGDDACGVVAINAVDFEAAPYCVFEGEKNGAGANILNGVAIGSGTPCVAVNGKGEDQMMYTFDEDILGNQIGAWKIGTAKTVAVAPEKLGWGGLLGNQNVGMFGVDGGLWLSQTRFNGMESGTPGLAYLDTEINEVTFRAADMAETDAEFLPSSTGGVCVNPVGDLVAVSTTTGVNVYLLSWNDTKPVVEKYATVEIPGITSNACALQFDYANNIYIANQANALFRVTLAEKEPVVTTPAKSADYIVKTQTGVDNIAVDNMDGEAVYYNLNGVRVNGELTPGLYIKSVNGKASKVVVK